MSSDCLGPKPISMFRNVVKNIEDAKYYQHELFSVLVEKRFVPSEDKFTTDTTYLLYPYQNAKDYISSWELKNA
jgi:hypothetical protein